MIIELTDRKKQVLEAIVSDYVDTAEPVGSFTITHHYIRRVSSATIRAEMAELEHIGYITHPHTSAGRVPTDLGYRYYVDNIMENKNLSGKDITLIKNGIKQIGRGIEQILRGTAKIISSLLGELTVFASFGRDRFRIYSSGYSNILKQPEFSDVSHARRVMELIEHEDLLARILEEYSRKQDLNILIGHENHFREAQDLSIIAAQYKLRGLSPGAIGIIGPTRMNYDRVTSILSYMSREFDNLLKEEINAR